MKRTLLLIGLIPFVTAMPAGPVSAQACVAERSGTLVRNLTLEHDGLIRYFDAYVPDGLPDSPVPLLFAFHGGGSNKNDFHFVRACEYMRLADQELFIVLYPNGTTRTGETGPGIGVFGWDVCRIQISDPPHRVEDDVGFVNALIDWAATSHNIDLERVYATGASNGGRMSARLAFELSNRIAAIGVVMANLPVPRECLELPANSSAVLRRGR